MENSDEETRWVKKAQLLIELAKHSVGSCQAQDAYKLHLEQLLEEFDLATAQLERVEKEVAGVLKQIPFASKLLAIKGISEITLAGIPMETLYYDMEDYI